MKTATKMKKSIRRVGYAMGTLTTENDLPKISYGAVKHLVTTTSGGREYTADPRGDSQEVYADGVKVYGDTVNDGYDINLTLLSLLDGEVKQAWLNEIKTDEGLAEYANGEEYPYFALILYEDTSDGVGLTSIYYWCQANGRPSDSGKTSEGGNFDWTFAQVPIVSTPRPTDMLVRYQIDGKELLSEVPEPDVTNASVSLNKHTVRLADEATETLTVSVVPSDQTVTWSSSDSTVATVSNGTITAVGAGSAIITAAITVDGATYNDTCTVIVSE